MTEKKSVPVFYACDDSFVKFTIVSITSLKANASRAYHYDIHVLYTEMSQDMREKTLALADDDFSITFDDVSRFLKAVNYRLHVRDYYSKTTYYRLFIPDLYPEYSKAVYVDSDTVVLGDISELYNYDLGDNYVGACNEQAMVQENVYGEYVEKCIGIDRNHFFNAGVLLINCAQFREKRILDLFIKLLHEYTFIVTQDEDYLNVICKDRVLWIDNNWDVEVFGEIKSRPEDFKLIHYIMVSKPWHYKDCRFGDFFWKYAEQTSVYDSIRAILDAYTDEQRKNDAASCDRLMQMAIGETNREDNFLNRQNLLTSVKKVIKTFISRPEVKQSEERLRILKKIDEYERAGRFDEDVEDDPPSRMIMPGEVDYEQKKLKNKIMAWYAFRLARNFIKTQMRQKHLIIRDIKGLENIEGLKSGAIITCNHFNAFDSFAIQFVYDEIHKRIKHGRFFRIIKEGNYTSFPGFYGILMRHCNTLPLSSNHRTMNEFMTAVDNLLKAGNFVLIYPEQSMWWNYRKPKPMKKGAFIFAAKSRVPVIPCFITMEDTDNIDGDGFPVQAYTIHISKPIFPQETFTRSENVEYMMNENYADWKKVYEQTYRIPLQYESN
jgi:lipopolysaccharide biosynthesis glycosyltransferase